MNESSTGCRLVCIILGVGAGALTWYFLSASVSMLPLIIISVFAAIATAWGLYEAFCGGSIAKAGTATAGGIAAVAASKIGVSDRDAWSSEPSSASSAAASAPANFVASKAPAKASASAGAKPKAKAKAKPAKAAAVKTKAPAKTTAAPKKAAAKKAPAKKAGPERLKKPKGKADDLKLISGVGPKLEGTLNGLGFWHFAQIAKWKKADVAIVDDELSFKGRIERDDWIKQAKALAKGGEAEYIKVFGKKPR